MTTHIPTAFTLVASLGLALTCTLHFTLNAQEADDTNISLVGDNIDSEGADASSGSLVLRIASDGDGAKGPSTEEGSHPPTEPSSPNTEDEDTPTFFGEALGGTFVGVIDVSDSMSRRDVESSEDYDGNVNPAPSRLEIVKYQLVSAILKLDESDLFDFVLLAGADNALPITSVWKGELVECTPENRAAAIEFVKGMTTWFGTPSYQALERATHDYGDKLDLLIFLSDGVPYPYQHGDRVHTKAILDDFPLWFESFKENGCRFVCVQAGKSTNVGEFMTALTAIADGEFIQQ